MTKTFKLSGIRLDEISLVDVPANAGAGIALFKRKESGMTPEQEKRMKDLIDKGMDADKAKETVMADTKKGADTEIAAQVEALTTQVADLTKRADAAEATATAIEKAATDAGLTVEKAEDGTVKVAKAADPEYVEINGEKVEKSSVPAPLLAMVQKQGEELAKMHAEKHEAELAKRGAAELPNLAGTDLVKGKMLAAAADDEDMHKALKAADAAMAKSMTEIGSNPQADEGSAVFKLDKMARTYAAEKGIPFASAYMAVSETPDGAVLAKQAIAESN